MSQNRLTRSDTDKVIAGVCGGLAAYVDLDPVIVRLAFVILIFASGIGLPIYLVLWVIMPHGDAVDQSNSEIYQKNIEEMGTTMKDSVNRYGRQGTMGVLLILLGAFFLLQQLGWLSGLGGGFFWPLLIIGVGIYFLFRRSQ